MISVVIAVFLTVIAVVGFLLKVPTGYDHRKDAQTHSRIPRVVGFAALGVAAVVLGLSMFTVVPPRQVGIPVTFGAPGQPMGYGIHAKAPWTDVTLMDGTIQPLDATGQNATIAKDADRSDVFVHNNVRWVIKEESAANLYMDYREFDKIGDLLVQPALRTAVAEVMSTYEPLAENQPRVEELGEMIKKRLQSAVGDRVIIQSVGVTLLDFSDATKNRINALNIERGNTAIAEQKAMTAAKEAEANRVLAESIKNDPNVVVSKCLDLVAEGRSLPAGFQCWPGTGGSVVLPAA